MISHHRLLCVLAAGISILFAHHARAQERNPVFEPTGFQQNRDYFSSLPFENIDTASGGLVLTFTDLVLPGNAGRDVRFQHTYNRKSGYWTFGIAGVPLRVTDGTWPDNLANDAGVTFYTADGGTPRALTALTTVPDNTVETRRILMSDRFWRYDRSLRRLSMPDGSVYRFDSNGRLLETWDAFGNRLELVWSAQPKELWVYQYLGSDLRVVVLRFAHNGEPSFGLGMASFIPTSMTFDGRTWEYGPPPMAYVNPPAGTGPGWQFQYGNPLIVTTPHGGQIEYMFKMFDFPDGRTPDRTVSTEVVDTLRVIDVRGQANGTWQYTYDFTYGPDLSYKTTIEAPDRTFTTFEHNWIGTDGNNLAAGAYPARTFSFLLVR